MNKLNKLPVSKTLPQNPSMLWMRRQCAIWLRNLYDFNFDLCEYYFLCHGWVSGNILNLASSMKENLQLPSGRSKEISEARRGLEALPLNARRNIHDNLEHLYENYPILQKQIREFMYTNLTEWLKQKQNNIRSIFPRGFKALFNLDNESLCLTAYAWGLGNYRPLEKFFEDSLHLNSIENAPILAATLGISQGRLLEIRQQLTYLGILDEEYGEMMRVTDNINQVLTAGSLAKVQNFFCKNLPPSNVPLEQFQIGEDEKSHALSLLKHGGSNPAHLLLYGPPGTGKSSFASQLVKTLKVKGWGVYCNERDSSKDRRVSLTACINLALVSPGSIIVVDEAEKLLDTDMDDSTNSSKAWLNDLLEKKNIRIIWITNMINHIDPAVRRRFSFSIHFQTLGLKESRQMWKNVSERLNLNDRFPEEKREYFAINYPVPVAVMESAAKQAKSLSRKKDFCDCMELILKSYMKLSNNGFWENKSKNTSEPSYKPEAICTSIPADKLFTRLKTLQQRILTSNLPGMGNILFYGPPGTGKTAFAHYLAEQLDMECISERASNILDPYVGETERKIAEIFAKARHNKALLLIDEVDSFLSSREDAERTWERTMVNEFLTALENHNGLCICTTNFRTIIDSAAMRRFPFKVEFCYASAERILLLFENILAPLSNEKLDKKLSERLCSLKHITPGDFRAVLSQFWLEDPDNVSCTQLIDALYKEQKMKLENSAKVIGFNS